MAANHRMGLLAMKPGSSARAASTHVCVCVCVCVCVWFLKAGFLCVALAVLELTL
jgi:hypothetical protein